MQCNGNFKQWFNIFLIISEAWQGYESKAYGVSNHNLKLQSEKLSRTRDIPNFPTQGWADTAFYMRKRSETYTTMCHKLYFNWTCHGWLEQESSYPGGDNSYMWYLFMHWATVLVDHINHTSVSVLYSSCPELASTDIIMIKLWNEFGLN